MLSYKSFLGLAQKVKSYKSVTGKATYINASVEGDVLNFVRQNTGKHWKLNLLEAYEVYTKEEIINTTILRRYMSSRVYSPTYGLLIAVKLYNSNGVRI